MYHFLQKFVSQNMLKMNELDKMSMEMFMNKSQYTKYISKTDPKKHQEIQIYNDNLKKYDGAITQIVADYCNNPNKQLTTEMDETFRHFAKTCFHYLEMKEIETASDEEDMLFTSSALYGTTHEPVRKTTQSLWGKGSRKAEELAFSCARIQENEK
jgi:hypothetical protein